MPAFIAKECRIWGNISVDRSPIFSRLRSSEEMQYGRPEISTTARDKAYQKYEYQQGDREAVQASSRGACPVPYLRMPFTSPRACLKAVPRAIAQSCAGREIRRQGDTRNHFTYLMYDGRRSRDLLHTSESRTIRRALRGHEASAGIL